MIKTPLSTVIGGAFWTPNCTILGGESRTLNQLIKSLFANNEQGFAYDPNDLTTMYQDATGTIPVTGAGQPVGLVLDKSKGLLLGDNLITNGSFKDGTTGWTLTGNSVLVDNSVSLTGGGQSSTLEQTIPTVVGKYYMITARVYDVAGSGLAISIVGALGFSGTRVFKATAMSTNILFRCFGVVGANNSAKITDITLHEVSGAFAQQATSSMRPLLAASPQRLDYDIADDNLIPNLPAQLTGCTVVRAVPNVGTQLLTNQTIPATYEDNKDHCGLIVINRALTPSETSVIAAEFNKRAGI